MKKNIKQRGITLIALVVTIVIMLLLAGITLNLSLGENGLIKIAQDTAEKYGDAQTNEEKTLQELQDVLNASKIEGKEDNTPGTMSGKGTKENPFLIQSIEDLVAFSNAVNQGTTYEGQEIKLMVNLNFQSEDSYVNPHTTEFDDVNKDSTKEELITELTTGEGFPPVGTDDTPFKGNFNGNNKVISNLYIDNSTLFNVGLFGVIENSKIYDLTVTGNIHTNIRADCGGIVNMSTGTSSINNVKNYTNIKSEIGNGSIGGIIAANGTDGNLTITNSVNYGNVENSNNTGGIIGYNGGTLLIENCHNEGSVTNTKGHYAGGILGRDNATTNRTTITNSYNIGDITSNTESELEIMLGGITGSISGTLTIDGCYNKGNVQNLRTEYTTGYYLDMGGIIGRISNAQEENIIKNSHNEGQIINEDRSGGIIGFSSGTLIIDKCYNSGLISSDEELSFTNVATELGGIIGGNGYKLYILNSYNQGNIINKAPQNSYSGAVGILAHHYHGASDAYIINSYNIGEMQSTAYALGLVSTASECNLLNSYNLGNLLDSRYSYGVGSTQRDGVINPRSDIYYWNNVASGITDVGTGMSEEQMKAASFATTLNDNIKNIDLSQISSVLSGYSLVQWAQGSNGYPELQL